MHAKRVHGWRVLSIAVAALIAVTMSPVLLGSASAGPPPPTSIPSSWAFGGETSLGVALTVNNVSFDLGSIAGLDVVFSAMNTSANVTELTLNRTAVASTGELFTSPYVGWTYAYRLAEFDASYANVTNAANVTLARQQVPALGLLNASTESIVELDVALAGTINNHTVKDSLYVLGTERTEVSFSPALGLFPLNLSWGGFWSSSATASGSAAWNITWSSVNQGWNGVTSSHNGSVNGTWSRTTQVSLFGQGGGWYSGWNDHLGRSGVLLSLSGPFDLYSGFLLYPHAFDVWRNFPGAISAFGLGSSWIGSEMVFLGPGRVTPWSLSAENMTVGGWAPYGSFLFAPTGFPVGFGQGAWATRMPLMTVWAQPESPHAAEIQAQSLLRSVGGLPFTPIGGLIPPAPSTPFPHGAWGFKASSTLAIGLQVDNITFGLATTSGDQVVYRATNTSANVTDLTLNRTIYNTVAEGYVGPGAIWGYSYRFTQTDSSSVNLTNATNVSVGRRVTVPALGILNASAQSVVSLQSSVGGLFGNRSVSASFDLLGRSNSSVSFSPALGLVPLNLSGICSWSSSALASGGAAWNTTWSAMSRGWNGVTTSHSGSIVGNWSKSTEVYLVGGLFGPCIYGPSPGVRTDILLGLSGPFDLYAGFLLVPHAFDLWAGFPGQFGAFNLGSSWIVTDGLYFSGGRITPWALTGENLVFGGTALFGGVFCNPWSFGFAFPFGGYPVLLPYFGLWGLGWGH